MRNRRIPAVLVCLSAVACAGVDATPQITPVETGAPSSEITVDLTSFRFVPDRIVATPGATITLTNRGESTPHTFTIERAGIDVLVGPSSTETITLSLGPGTYPVICRFHGGQGMVGTVEV